tara:strand:+ start:23 stop:457 length:435 start_codon:yes stop_codon:yes gene_type:complete
MNYVNITDEKQTVNIVLNYDFNLEEGRNGDDIDFYLYKDGSGVNVVEDSNGNISVDTSIGSDLEWSGNVSILNYYQKVGFSEDVSEQLEDEKIYSLVAIARINNKDKIVYRGKFQTTQQPLEDYSVNNSRYNQKTTTNNYTILD